MIFPSGRSNWLQITKNRFLRFLPFYPRLIPLYGHFRLSHALQTVDLEEIYRLVPKILNFMACGLVLRSFSVSCKNFVGSASKIYRNSIESLSKFYRNSIENLSKFYGNYIGILLKFYRNCIEILYHFCRNPIDLLSKLYQKSIEIL